MLLTQILILMIQMRLVLVTKVIHFTTISGRRVFVKADKNIPKTARDGPKLDKLDKDIFGDVRRYAAERLGETAVHKSWTMVRGSFLKISYQKPGCKVLCFFWKCSIQ